MPTWHLESEISRTTTPWVSLVAERWRKEGAQAVDYWRVERPDSIIVLPLQANGLWLVNEEFRPGVNRCTLDFPGGRLPERTAPEAAANQILRRELGAGPEAVESLRPINTESLDVDSSFSSQRLHGFIAELRPDWRPAPERTNLERAPLEAGARSPLLARLTCLQCRALLLEWWFQQGANALA